MKREEKGKREREKRKGEGGGLTLPRAVRVIRPALAA